MYSIELRERSFCYLAARQAQEGDHTDEVLDWERTEAHDALMMQLDIEGIAYKGREGAAAVAEDVDSITKMEYNGDG